MRTLDWSDKLDKLIHDAIKAGEVTGKLDGVPDSHIETGLAHVFFYDNVVYKLYKTHSEMDHFIKGVLAPTKRRKHCVEYDFYLNKYFSGGIYHDIHSVYIEDGVVEVKPYDGSSIHVLYEMDRLNFEHNFHEQLLSGKVEENDLYQIGYDIARLVTECEVEVPVDLCWYDLASERMDFLKQFLLNGCRQGIELR